MLNHQWVNGQTNRYSHAMEYYPAMKMDALVIHITIWMNLQKIMLNLKRLHVVFFHLYNNLEITQLQR